MAVPLFYGVVILILFTLPDIFMLWPITYSMMSAAHFIVFLMSVVLFVMMGRALRRRQKQRFMRGFITGAVVGFVGTAVGQYIRHLPMAEEAFMRQLHGVPHQAAMAMLHLHVVSGTLINGLMYGFLYAFLGGFATWWGGRRPPRNGPTSPSNRENPKTANEKNHNPQAG